MRAGVPGPGVDAEGAPVVDPTANVLALVEAAAKRLDDLAALRSNYEAQLRQAETARIDAIRAVDVGAVQRAAEVAAAQAEALRNQVAVAATATAAALAAALDPIQKRLDDLTRAQYETVGQKSQITESRSSSGLVIAAVGLGITTLVTLIALVAFVLNAQP